MRFVFGRLRVGCLALCVALATPASSQDGAVSCTRWAYDPDGGFEGGEHIAWTSCATPTSEFEFGLTLSCSAYAVAFRVYPGEDNAPMDVGPIETAFDFGSGPVILYAHHEGADGAYAAYIAGFDLDHPVLAGLKAAAKVDITLKGRDETVTILLDGARAAIGAMQAACQADR